MHSDLPSNPGSTDQCDADNLVVLQSQKAELQQRRDALAARKDHLQQAAQRLRLTLAHYRQQEAQYETRQKLEYYLHQNDREFARLQGPDDAASFVLDNLHVLPATDAVSRRKLMARFYPCVSVESPRAEVEQHGELVKVLRYTLAAPGVPPLDVRVSVKNEAVHRTEICNYADVRFLLRRLSPSYHACLATNYAPHNKVDLLMYSYHSLASLQQARTSALAQILDTFPALVATPAAWDGPDALSLLKHIELCIDKRFYVRLSWEMAMADPALGDMESVLNLSIYNADREPLRDPTDVFLTLVREHGVVQAFVLTVKNIFGI